MSENLTKRVNFDLIRYANCWEDADILLEGLASSPGARLLSIGSAGDNSFSLLATNPDLVVAVDVNKTQLYLIELKKVAISQLDYGQVLAFFGFAGSTNRLQVYAGLKSLLTPDTRAYWDRNQPVIEKGIIYGGKFEKYFTLFSKRILPFIHNQKKVAELFRKKSAEEQIQFYASKWNSLRWKLLFKVFFSKYVMGKYGRDPEFLKEVKVTVSDYIYGKAGRHLQTTGAQDNFILHFNLTGSFGNLLPNYLQRENFGLIKNNIDRIEIFEGYAQDAISRYGKFNGMNLSNIFEYMDSETFAATAKSLVDGLQPGGRLAYWNLMVARRISGLLPNEVSYQRELSHALSEKDKGFFYNQFIIDQKG